MIMPIYCEHWQGEATQDVSRQHNTFIGPLSVCVCMCVSKCVCVCV